MSIIITNYYMAKITTIYIYKYNKLNNRNIAIIFNI